MPIKHIQKPLSTKKHSGRDLLVVFFGIFKCSQLVYGVRQYVGDRSLYFPVDIKVVNDVVNTGQQSYSDCMAYGVCHG